MTGQVEGSSNSDGGAQETTAPASKKERPYRVLREVTFDLTDPASIIHQLKKLNGDTDDPVTVLAIIGVGSGGTPKEGLNDLAQRVDLAGDYEAIAEGSIVKFVGVKAETRRVVVVG